MTPVHSVTLGQGAPSLLMHCSLASHRSLLPLAALLPGQKTLVDMPGHGASADWDRVTDYQSVCADAVTRLLDGLTHLIGHSFGATVALRLTCHRPDLVSRLTLIEPVFFAITRGTPAWDAYRLEFAPYYAAIQTGDLPLATREFHGLWNDGPWDSLPPKVQAALIQRIPLIAAGAPAMEQDNAGLLVSGALTRIRVPVTLIRGALSPAVIPEIHAALMKLIPKATDHVVAGAAHMVPVTHPAQVAAIITGQAVTSQVG